MRQRNILLFSILFFSFGLANAQTTDTIPTQQISEVKVATAAKPSSTLSSTPLQSLSGSEMKKTGIQSVADAMRRFNGVVVKDYGGIGGFKAVNIRGNGAEHTAILYDGVSVSNAQSGQIDISQFSLQNIDMLTLSIGQNDNIFRTARSVASVGSLDITTVSPGFSLKNYRVQMSMEAGAWGLFNPYLYYARKLNDKFSLSVDGSWQRADGQYKYELPNVTQVETGKRRNSDIDILRTEINLFGNLTPTQTVLFKGYVYDAERGLPGAVILYNADNGKERLWDKNYFAQGKYLNHISKKFDLQLLGKFSHNYTRYIDKNPVWGKGGIESRYHQNELYINGIMLYKLSDELSLSLSEDFSYNTLKANTAEFTDPHRYSLLSVVSGKYETHYLTITGSLLGTYVTEKVKTGNKPDDRKRLSPAISMSYKPFSSTNLRLRASYKNTFRIPTFNDMYYVRLGNRNLVPEDARQLNVGTTWSDSFSEIFNYFSVTGDFFYNKVKNKIVVYPSTYESRMVNLGDARITGFDLQANGNFDLNEKISIQLTGNYTYQKAINLTDPNAKDYKSYIPYSPVHSGGGSLSIPNPWVNLGYSVIAAGKSYSSTANTEWFEVDGYADHTLSLNKTFDMKSYTVRVQADVTNIMNKTYYIVSDYPMAGRGYRITVHVKF